MKRILMLLCTLAVLTTSFAATAPPVKKPLKAAEVFVPVGHTGRQISLLQLSQLSADQFESLSGQKLNVFGRLSFKLGQRELRQSIRKDGTLRNKRLARFAQRFDDGEQRRGFHLGGFAIGFFGGLIGAALTYLFKDENRRRRTTWAWIGWGVWVVLWLAVILPAL
ncbi:MAG TPA: hypothetical protein VHK69_12585 [Chitinophagaceae bacterium]|jgi:hypothetical protein|nr:hypothetical protein [Chitinophagaceae bacterium]